MSAFADASPSFEAFLDRERNAPSTSSAALPDRRNACFVPRNFLLDERVGERRAGSYASVLPATGPTSFVEWNGAHNLYLERHVFAKPPAGHDYQVVDTEDPTVCPETFRSTLALAAFEGTDLDTHLIRMVAVADLAWLAGRTENEFFGLGQRSLLGDTAARAALAMILEDAFTGAKCAHRPVFAGFYEDFLDELGDAGSTAWPNQLRDRLGLYHINQWSHPFPRRVFLFRYPVRDIPRRPRDVSRRPIALPTVLDQRFAEAFCPAPPELTQGQLVDLRENAKQSPARELLHLFMPMKVGYLFRVGTVTAPVPSHLGPARRDHLIWLRLLADSESYAAATDNDLFSP